MTVKKPMMKPIRTIQRLLDSLPENIRKSACEEIDSLAAVAPDCLDAPALLAAKKAKEEKLRLAGNALMDLPHPFKEFYAGIGKHLLTEADKTKRQIDRFPAPGIGRPPGIGKLRFIDLCDDFVNRFFPVPRDVPPGSSLLGLPRVIRRESITLAMDIWKELNLGETSVKAWETLVKDGWESYLQALRDGVFR